MGGKIDEKSRSNPFRTLNLNLSSMLPNDLMSDGQSQTGSFVNGARMFGGKERVKDVVKVFRRDAVPRILDLYLSPHLTVRFFEPSGPHSKGSGFFTNGIHRIQEQV